MKKNRFGGLFIAVDGPSGVGKTSLIKRIHLELYNRGIDVYCTQEPTHTIYGDFVRKSAENLTGESLACFVAADRYFHLENEIIPRLNNREVVLTDRYVLSSLVFQCMDNVDPEFILSINEKIISPDIQLVITADERTIQKRLNERTIELTRFERGQRTTEELYFQKEAVKRFFSLGINTIEIENINSIQTSASIAVNHICRYINNECNIT